MKISTAGVVFSAWALGCVFFWNGSTLAGGSYQNEASNISHETAGAFQLTPLCRKAAENLALASIRAKITEFRPTNKIMKNLENEAIELWDMSRCPDKALLGVAYGVSAVTIEDKAKRRGERL